MLLTAGFGTYILVRMNQETPIAERRRDPDYTRNVLLDAAFEEMHENGYRSASLDKIYEASGVTRGALYHHFGGKMGLGYAVVEERILPRFRELYIQPFLRSDDIREALSEISDRMKKEFNNINILLRGCPVNNLTQEMSGIDEGFRLRLAAILEEWRDAVAVCIRRSQAKGTVRKDIEPLEAATFMVAAFEGAIGFAKNAQDVAPFELCRGGLGLYVKALSPEQIS